jgi:hypothetical protein
MVEQMGCNVFGCSRVQQAISRDNMKPTMIYCHQNLFCFFFFLINKENFFLTFRTWGAVAGRDWGYLTLLLHIVTKVDNIFILLLETQKGLEKEYKVGITQERRAAVSIRIF